MIMAQNSSRDDIVRGRNFKNQNLNLNKIRQSKELLQKTLMNFDTVGALKSQDSAQKSNEKFAKFMIDFKDSKSGNLFQQSHIKEDMMNNNDKGETLKATVQSSTSI